MVFTGRCDMSNFSKTATARGCLVFVHVRYSNIIYCQNNRHAFVSVVIKPSPCSRIVFGNCKFLPKKKIKCIFSKRKN